MCLIFIPPLLEGGEGYTVLPLFFCPSFRPSKVFFVAFFSVTVDGRNLIFGHKHHICIPYMVVFLDPSDSYFLFADLVGLYTHWIYNAPSVYRQTRLLPKFSSVPISPITNTLLYCQTQLPPSATAFQTQKS